MTRRRRLLWLGALPMILAACTGSTGDGDVIRVSSRDDACQVSATEAAAGTVLFTVTNDGTDVTEFYLYAADRQSVIGEVEDISPGLSRNLTVEVEPGEYVTACKPAMTGDGIRGDFTVTS
jgi:iron uptake system component EfeO